MRIAAAKKKDHEASSKANEFGFRCLAKKDWENMKREYLALQQKLVKKAISSSSPPPIQTRIGEGKLVEGPSSPRPQRTSPDTAAAAPGTQAVDKDASRGYPLDCLVFVKNVHPDTNKTTLKALFLEAIGEESDTIDYVDYTKGLDTVRPSVSLYFHTHDYLLQCYLRLTSSTCAISIHSHFSGKRLAQTGALSSYCGELPVDHSSRPIEVEIVRGRKEEMYWQKVPEKVRKVALEKVEGHEVGSADTALLGDVKRGKKRKRRR